MNDQKAKIILDQADQLAGIAEQELYKPEEDVVNYVVCRNAFQSVNKYLIGFLVRNGIEIPSEFSLGELHNRCCAIDPAFMRLNLKPLFDAIEKEDVWMNPATAKEFLNTSRQARMMVMTARS